MSVRPVANASEDAQIQVILPYEVTKEYTVESITDIPVKPVYSVIKRLTDILVSLIALTIGAIPMLMIAMTVKCTSPGPALYIQERLGKNGKKFNIVKFRTMFINAEENGAQWSVGDADSRATRFGRFLRHSRLDELPQFWNILIGNMSLVGPRPEREVFYNAFEEYIHGYRERMKIVPGLSGYAQVYGGLDLKPEEKICYDIEYIKRRSLWLDFKIIVKTALIVFHLNFQRN